MPCASIREGLKALLIIVDNGPLIQDAIGRVNPRLGASRYD